MSVSRRRKKRLDQKAKKKYTKLWGNEDMSSKKSNVNGTTTYKYYMDERDFLSKEIPLDEKLIIFDRPNSFMFFYISYEFKSPIVITPAGFPSVRDRLPAGTLTKFDKLSEGEFGGRDYRLYGYIDDNNVFYFYDLKINDNYLNWIDFGILMKKYNIPFPENFEVGEFKSFDDLNAFLIKKNKGNDDFFYRPVLEPLPSVEDRFGTSCSSKSSRKIIEFPKKEETEIETTIVNGENGINEIALVTAENKGEGANKTDPFCGESSQDTSGMSTQCQTDLSSSIEDLDFGHLNIEELDDNFYVDDRNTDSEMFDSKFAPLFTSTLFDDLGNIDDSILDLYFEYYTQEKYIDDIMNMFQREAIDIQDYNKSFLCLILKEYVVDKILTFLSEFEGFDITAGRDNVETMISNKLTFKANSLVNKIIFNKKGL